MNRLPTAPLVLCRSDAGDGGWSLHAPGSTDEQIANGEAPALLDGDAEWDGDADEWSAPTADDYAEARLRMSDPPSSTLL